MKSKRHIDKVMGLCAAGRPQGDFNGILGIYRCSETKEAQRASKFHAVGDRYEVDCEVNGSRFVHMIRNHLIRDIQRKLLRYDCLYVLMDDAKAGNSSKRTASVYSFRDPCTARLVLRQRSSNKKICVGQRLGKTRRISNFDEVRTFLQNRFNEDIHTLVFENADLREQIRRVDECRVLVAPHGGGMTNAAFLKRSSRVLEIFPAHYQYIYYYEHAVKSAGAHYVPLIVPVEHVVMGTACDVYRNETYDQCKNVPECQECFKQSNMTVGLIALGEALTALGL